MWDDVRREQSRRVVTLARDGCGTCVAHRLSYAVWSASRSIRQCSYVCVGNTLRRYASMLVQDGDATVVLIGFRVVTPGRDRSVRLSKSGK